MNKEQTPKTRTARSLATLGLAVAALTALPACAPLLLGGAMVGTAMVAVDRRTTGAQFEDQAIELKAGNRISDLRTNAHINVTSYNRTVLLSGEASTEADRARIQAAVEQVENLRRVVNEVAIMGATTITARTNDSVLSGKVKATLVDAADIEATAVKVVTERGNVYLMGRVTEREAARAAQLASHVSGVQKVVRVFEILTPEELARIQTSPRK